MINTMSKRIVILGGVILFSFNLIAQGRFGVDEQRCKESLSIFREYYKQKNYIDAFTPWIWAFKNCPASLPVTLNLDMKDMSIST